MDEYDTIKDKPQHRYQQIYNMQYLGYFNEVCKNVTGIKYMARSLHKYAGKL